MIAAARALLASRRNAEATSLLVPLAAADPTGEADELLGDALFALERYGPAAVAYAAAVNKGFADPTVHEKLAVARTNAFVLAAHETEAPPFPVSGATAASPPRHSGSPMGADPSGRGLVRRLGRFSGELFEGVWTNWYHKPKALAILKLARMRAALNEKNLHDAYRPGNRSRLQEGPFVKPENAETVRTIDGTYNDLDDPTMGAAGVRFGRNVPLEKAHPDPEMLLKPNPREISLKLMTRDEFKPVPFLNLLAASWIQFMTHDWFSHGPTSRPGAKLIEVPLTEDDPLRKKHHTRAMFVPATAPDPSRSEADDGLPPTHLNEVTHWWDASQIYGSDEATTKKLRSFESGKLALDKEGRLPLDGRGIEETGFKRNWWVGLSMLHELFAKEHNAICDMLKKSHPGFDDQRLYDTARLINAAQMAKIHTVEWTPAILPNPTLERAMNANWSGLIKGGAATAAKELLPRFAAANAELFGIVGGARNLHGVPYSITEEFVSVYRMHPLLPESLEVAGEDVPLAKTRQAGARKLVEKAGMTSLWNTFGHSHPGALTLNNYPRFLQNLSIPGLPVFDLAAVDILRDRERGVPRYNEFRRALQLKPIASLEDLTDDAGTIAKLKDLYGDDVEALDLLVGCLAEGHRPAGFGFGETAFQVFILNASRRLQADRFYTTDYRAEVYTGEGIDRIEACTMKDILLRHYPELQESGLPEAKTAFHPWKPAEQPGRPPEPPATNCRRAKVRNGRAPAVHGERRTRP